MLYPCISTKYIGISELLKNLQFFYGKIPKIRRRPTHVLMYLKAIGETRILRIENWLSKFGHRPKE